jgi:hypothetical protein
MTLRTEPGGISRGERRAWARTSNLELAGIASGRVLPGRAARILDLGRGGALIETGHRLLPGTSVELQLGEAPSRYRVRARILRCHVAALDRHGGIRYRGAVAFEEQVPFDENAGSAEGS